MTPRPANAADSPDTGHMLFTDSTFLLRFLPPLLALFFIAVAVTPRSWREGARRFSLANVVLLAGSIVFLLGGAGAFIRLIAASVLFNYPWRWRSPGRGGSMPHQRVRARCRRRC